MIVGLGVDLVEISRLARAIDRAPLLRARVFTPAEAQLPVRSLAARWAAKESVAKALGSPGDLAWHDVEVMTDGAGVPVLHVTGRAAERAEARGVTRWWVSLSHDGGFAVATVVAEGA